MTSEDKYKELKALVFKRNKNRSYISRINEELTLIKKQASEEFFLIAFDIVSDLKQKNVIVGPSNGYANSSLINFILGLTTINPIQYDLPCEPYFRLNRPFLHINISNKKAISKKHLKLSKDIDIKIEELVILRIYHKLAKVNYKFNPKNLKRKGLRLEYANGEMLHFTQWKFEVPAMKIENENDLINSIAFSHFGMKGFHLSRILHREHITFKEFPLSNGFLLFQEQWIKLVAKFTNNCINDIWEMKSRIGKGKYLLSNFTKNFTKRPNKKIITYLFEIIPYLPSKSNTIAKAHILSLALNFKGEKTFLTTKLSTS